MIFASMNEKIISVSKVFFSPIEAWNDFEKNVVPFLPRPLPAEITNARYSALNRKGYPSLGLARCQRLLETYAPDRYEFSVLIRLK